MIKNFVFDIGGVIYYFDYDSIFPRFSRNPLDWLYLFQHVCSSYEWTLIDYGFLSVEDGIKAIQDKTNHENDELIENFWLHCHDNRPVAENVVSRILHLKDEGYGVYLLSNTGPTMFESFASKCNLIDFVDGYLLSYQVGQIKPYKSIFLSLLDKFKLNANECAFIDDNLKNIKTAKELGFDAHFVINNSENSVLNSIDDILKLKDSSL